MSRLFRSRTRSGLGCMVLFAAPFALVGLVVDLSLLKLGYDDLQMHSWRETPCTILAAELIEVHGSDSTTRRITARYRYSVDGVEHDGRRVSLDFGSDNVGTWHQRTFSELEEYRNSGQPFRCFVNPGRPEESILYRDLRWELTALQTLLGIVFSAVGFGMLAAVISVWRAEAPPAGHDVLPWNRRIEWVRNEMKSSDRRVGTYLWWIGWLTLIISGPCLLSSGAALVLHQEHLAGLGLLPTGLGLLLLETGRRRLKRWRRYGDSTLTLAKVPGVVGGLLAGTVRTDGRVESPDGFRVRLYCTETAYTSGDNDSSSNRVVWDEERTVIRELSAGELAGTVIPIVFPLPYDAPETAIEPKQDQRDWRLAVRAATPSVDYQATFVVPVFRTEESLPDFRPDQSLLAQYEAPTDSGIPLVGAGIVAEPLDQGGMRFVFPRGRNVGFSAAMLLVLAVFGALIVAGVWYWWPAIWPYVAALLAWGWLRSLFDQFLYASEVEVTPMVLVVRGGIFSGGADRSFEPADIKQIVIRDAGNAGSVTACDLCAVLNNGASVILGKRITPKSTAERIRQRIEAILIPGGGADKTAPPETEDTDSDDEFDAG